MESVPRNRAGKRLMWFGGAILLWACLILVQLFRLQVVHHADYLRAAQRQQEETVEIAAPRGSIFDRSGQLLAGQREARLRLHRSSAGAGFAGGLRNLVGRAADRSGRAVRPHAMVRRQPEGLHVGGAQRSSRSSTTGCAACLWTGSGSRVKAGGTIRETRWRRTSSAPWMAKRPASGAWKRAWSPTCADCRAACAYSPTPKGAASIRKWKPNRGPASASRFRSTNASNCRRRTRSRARSNRRTAESGSVVVMDPYHGDILAIASYPPFDPNNPPGRSEDPTARFNHAVSVPFEPGSVFKVITLSAALETTDLKPSTMINCGNGSFTMAGRTVHEAHHGYGTMPMEMVLAKSSNIGAIQIGLKVGSAKLYEYVRRFGLGARTGIPLPAESPGMVRKLSKWRTTSLMSVSMGHEVGVTTLQLAQACSVVANGGLLVPPRLILKKGDGSRTGGGSAPDPEAGNRHHDASR